MFRTLWLRIMGSRGLLRALGRCDLLRQDCGSPLPLRGRFEEGRGNVAVTAEPPSFFSSVVIATYTLLLMILFSVVLCTASVVDAADSSFTQADRDRMIRLEEGLKATNQRLDDNLRFINQRFDAINQRFDATNQRIDDLKGLIYVLLSGMFVLVGFILWDRRTTLAPVVRATKELEAYNEKLTLAIKEKAEKDPELKEALRHAGLM